jgi:hypothetical protein
VAEEPQCRAFSVMSDRQVSPSCYKFVKIGRVSAEGIVAMRNAEFMEGIYFRFYLIA